MGGKEKRPWLHPPPRFDLTATDGFRKLGSPPFASPKTTRRSTVSIAQSFLAEFENQAPITRRFLERLPADKLAWQPHPRSMTAGQLAFHIATVPANVLRFIQAP